MTQLILLISENGLSQVPKKTLQQLVESTKHSFIARLIVAANKVVVNKTAEGYDFIACVEKKHKPECLSLSRRGRDKLTAVIVYDVWDRQELTSSFESKNQKIPAELEKIITKYPNNFCFCRCNITIREVEIRGPSR